MPVMSDCVFVGAETDHNAAMDMSSDKSLFEPTVDMMVNDFDDERTLDEEEALAAGEQQDPTAELNSLQREGDMPLEELLALYGYDRTSNTRTCYKMDPEKHITMNDIHKPEPSALQQLYSDSALTEPSRFLRSVSRPPSEEEDDYDYSPEEDDWRKTIMVGSDYQAWIPEGLCSYDDALPYENEDKLIWNPSAIKETVIEEYMLKINAMSSPGVGVNTIPTGPQLRDDEQALYLLQQCGHNVEEALRRRRISASAPTESMSLWSEEECRNFENGLKAHGKDFHLIQQHKVRTRSVGEVVQFYYIWKKTERHDIFANKARLEKKKYTLHPGHTDYMDRFLEEQDGGNGHDRSSAPMCLVYEGKGAVDQPLQTPPPDPLAIEEREVFSELPRTSPTHSYSAEETDQESNVIL